MGKIDIFSVTTQAVCFSVVSTTLAQCIIAWRQQSLNFTARPYLTFILTTLITTPPNYLYQEWLETTFPTLVPNSTPQTTDTKTRQQPATHFSKTYALIKFLCDQTLGAAVNTVLFIALAGLFSGNNRLDEIATAVHEDFWTSLLAGWRVWPFVTILNLCVVPWEWRPFVGNTAGLGWGVYLTLVNMDV